MTTRWCGAEKGFVSVPTQKDYAAENRKLRKRVSALTAVLVRLDRSGGLGLDKHEWIRVVLDDAHGTTTKGNNT